MEAEGKTVGIVLEVGTLHKDALETCTKVETLGQQAWLSRGGGRHHQLQDHAPLDAGFLLSSVICTSPRKYLKGSLDDKRMPVHGCRTQAVFDVGLAGKVRPHSELSLLSTYGP